jgi:6-phosphofructokinase
MTRQKTLGILTGGGDVPGLNPCMKAVVERAIDEGWQVQGLRKGWASVLHFNPDSPGSRKHWVVPLNKQVVRTIDRSGGTFLHTSRTNPQRVRLHEVPKFLEDTHEPNEKGILDFTDHALRVLEQLEIDALIPIGGDDTLSYAARLHTEGFPVVAVPKTMDNDVYGTDYCIGFSTAVTRSVDFITALRTPSGSHERIAVIELFGRNSGETSLISAYLADVDRAIISEVPFNVHKLAMLLLQDKHANPSNYAVMTISEGAREIEGDLVHYDGDEDAYGHRKLGGIGAVTGEKLKQITGENIIYQQLGYLMRSGAPDSLDRMVAVSYGQLAMDLVSQGRSGRMVALRDGVYTHVPLNRVISGTKRVDVDEMYDVDEYRPQIADMLGKPMFLY